MNIQIPEFWMEFMKQHASSKMPEEACGLLGGQIVAGHRFLVQAAFDIENTRHANHRFEMEPRAMLGAFKEMDLRGLELVGIYHSHPQGPAWPSETDLNENTYPGTPYLILSREGGEWRLYAYEIRPGEVAPVDVIITDT